MKREFGCTSVTLLARHVLEPGEQELGRQFHQAFGHRRGKLRMRQNLLFDRNLGATQPAYRRRLDRLQASFQRHQIGNAENESFQWIRGERVSTNSPPRPHGIPPSTWARARPRRQSLETLDFASRGSSIGPDAPRR